MRRAHHIVLLLQSFSGQCLLARCKCADRCVWWNCVLDVQLHTDRNTLVPHHSRLMQRTVSVELPCLRVQRGSSSWVPADYQRSPNCPTYRLCIHSDAQKLAGFVDCLEPFALWFASFIQCSALSECSSYRCTNFRTLHMSTACSSSSVADLVGFASCQKTLSSWPYLEFVFECVMEITESVCAVRQNGTSRGTSRRRFLKNLSSDEI